MTLVVRFRFDTDGAKDIEGRTNDVSKAGVFIETAMAVLPESVVHVTLMAPSAWEPLQMTGLVKWVGERGGSRGFGVHFETLTPVQQTALAELLDVAGYATA
ncbi:MAG: PilZ domain-containing protein [Sandaracinaceae bacterium]|jgi:hypothetical protein|nr:PilZ domain-containing protein [Sandaracinaceae bacterium]